MTVFVQGVVFTPDDPDDMVIDSTPGLFPRGEAVEWARGVFAQLGQQAYRAWFECYSFDGFEWVPTGEIGEMDAREDSPRWFGGES